MGGGSSGGGTSVQQRNPAQEKGTVGNWYDFQQNQAQNYLQNTPLLNQASQGAQSFWGGLPGMLGQFGGYQNQLSGLNQQTGALGSQLSSWLGQVNPIIQSGGALTPQMSRDVSQQTRNIASAQGTAGVQVRSGLSYSTVTRTDSKGSTRHWGKGKDFSGSNRAASAGETVKVAKRPPDSA